MQQTSQMEAPVYYYSTGESSRRPGLPLSHPNNPQVMFASRPHLNPNLSSSSSSSSHYRSLSPSSVFDTLPSWTPMNNMLINNNNNNNNNIIFNNYRYNQYHEPSSSSPTFVGVDQSLTGNVVPRVEGRAGNSHGLSATPSPLPLGGESFLPRKGHRRSVSDTPLGLSAKIASSPQLMSRGESSVSQSSNVEGMSEDEIVEDLMSEYLSMKDIDAFTVSGNEREFDSGGSVSENEVDSRSSIGGVDGVGSSEKREVVKRRANEDIGLTAGHCRSVSMDSYLEFLNFADDDDVARGVPVQAQVAPFSLGTSLVDARMAMLRMKWEGEFCEADLRKIVVNDKLTRIALEDPRHAKRILANRLSAARSKERKVRYIAELEQKVKTLLAETDTLSTKNTTLQKDSAGVSKLNKELKFRLEAIEQEAKLKNALNESLTSELERLRILMDEMTELSSYLLQQLSLNNQVLQNHCQQSISPNIYQLQQQQQDLLLYQLQQQQQDFQANQFQPEF